MPTLNISVAASADDAFQSGSTMTLNGANIRLNSASAWAGFRFLNVTIAVGSTIDVAYIEIERGAASSSPNLDIYGHDTDDAGTFTSSNDDISNRTRTTAVTNWNASLGGAAGDRFQSPSIVSVIQEIVDRGGWASGNDIAIIFDALGGDVQIRSYDNASGDAALLHIEYTEAVGGGQPTQARRRGSTLPTGAQRIGRGW